MDTVFQTKEVQAANSITVLEAEVLKCSIELYVHTLCLNLTILGRAHTLTHCNLTNSHIQLYMRIHPLFPFFVTGINIRLSEQGKLEFLYNILHIVIHRLIKICRKI